MNHSLLKKTIVLMFSCFFAAASAQKSQRNPLDTIQPALNRLQKELDEKYQLYYDSYKVPGVYLNAVTLYEYNNKNELACEKSFSKGSGYSMYFYERNNKVQSITSSGFSTRMVTDKYDDEDGVLMEETEYTPHNIDKKVYRGESVEHKNKDTVTYKTYANNRLEWTRIYIYSKEKKLLETDMYHYDDTVASKTFYREYDEKGKHIEVMKSLNPSYDYNTENTYVYNSKKLLEKSTKVNLNTNKKEASVFSYNSDGREIKEEQYKEGVLSFTINSEYDAHKNLVAEKGINAAGMLVYQCIYLYDNKNNKIAYLYFYFIEDY